MRSIDPRNQRRHPNPCDPGGVAAPRTGTVLAPLRGASELDSRPGTGGGAGKARLPPANFSDPSGVKCQNARSPGLRPRAPANVRLSTLAYLQHGLHRLMWHDGMQHLILLQQPANVSQTLQLNPLKQDPTLSQQPLTQLLAVSQQPLTLSNRQQPWPQLPQPLLPQPLLPQPLSHGLQAFVCGQPLACGPHGAAGAHGAGHGTSTHVGTILHTVTVSWTGTHSVTQRVAW